jgi:WD40 repeat protein
VSIEDSLACPFGTEDEPDNDLAKLHPCGHFVSRQAWLTYESKNPEKNLRCPRCNSNVSDLGYKLPMTEIRKVIAEVKEGSQWLKDVLDETSHTPEAAFRFPSPKTKSVSCEEVITVENTTSTTGVRRDTERRSSSRLDTWDGFRPEADPRPERPQSLIKDPPTSTISSPGLPPFTSTEVPELKINEDHIYGSTSPAGKHVVVSACVESRPGDSIKSSKPTSLHSVETFQSQRSQADPLVHITGVKTTVSMRVGQKGNLYQATTISASCLSLALITPVSFTIYSIPRRGATFDTICYGFNDGTYGRPKEKQSKYPRGSLPRYRQAALSDTVLCLACEEACIDIHDATTGKRRTTLTLPQPCWTLQMSPNGKQLAIAIENGELLLYNTGPAGDFDTNPLWIIQDVENLELRLVTCIAFSPDSKYMSVCTMDNIIRTYRLDIASHSISWISTYNRDLTERACRDPYYGVTGLAL